LASRTAPYFHDGSVATLDEAIVMMGRFQLGERLESHDVAAIAAFIESLAGTVEDR
jgi:cytochrome c peroxidase